MSTDRKFYRTIYTVEVFSKNPPPFLSDVCVSLLHEQIEAGESIVDISAGEHYTLTAGQMQEALALIGVSNPSLFGLPDRDEEQDTEDQD